MISLLVCLCVLTSPHSWHLPDTGALDHAFAPVRSCHDLSVPWFHPPGAWDLQGWSWGAGRGTRFTSSGFCAFFTACNFDTILLPQSPAFLKDPDLGDWTPLKLYPSLQSQLVVVGVSQDCHFPFNFKIIWGDEGRQGLKQALLY